MSLRHLFRPADVALAAVAAVLIAGAAAAAWPDLAMADDPPPPHAGPAGADAEALPTMPPAMAPGAPRKGLGGPGGPAGPGGPGGPLVAAWFSPGAERGLADVDATPEQRQRIHAIGRELHDALRQSHDALRPLEAEMAAQFAKPTLDAAALDALRQRIDDQRAKDSRRVLDASIAAANVLNPTQRARFVEQTAAIGAAGPGPAHGRRHGDPKAPDGAVPPPDPAAAPADGSAPRS